MSSGKNLVDRESDASEVGTDEIGQLFYSKVRRRIQRKTIATKKGDGSQCRR